VCLQAENFPNKDLTKSIFHQKWSDVTNRKDAYTALVLGPACVPEKCDVSHKYSIKIYTRTAATFDAVPDNVIRWYSTNVAVFHDKIRCLPFGLEAGAAEIINKFKNHQKKNLCYANFHNHTIERIQLMNWLTKQSWCKTVTTSVPLEQYLDDTANSMFTIAPEGNGYDCYRTYEAIQLDTIPILSITNFSENLAKLQLPILRCGDYYQITQDNLEFAYENMIKQQYNLRALELDFWQDIINEDKKLLR